VKQNLLIIAGAAVLGVIMLRMIFRLFRRSGSNPNIESVVCSGCGWRGSVSRYAGRCPRCNEFLGEQKSQRRL
jgi:predicted Zn-ribbon and HTH transcriptional regulator